MKCLCCGTWTYPHPWRPFASQVGHYCSHLQRAWASLRPQWCQSSGICRNTAGDEGRCFAHLPGGWKTEEKIKKQQQQCDTAPRAKLRPQPDFCCPQHPEITERHQRGHGGWIAYGASLLSAPKTRLYAGSVFPVSPFPLMTQCINTFSHQQRADVLS